MLLPSLAVRCGGSRSTKPESVRRFCALDPRVEGPTAACAPRSCSPSRPAATSIMPSATRSTGEEPAARADPRSSSEPPACTSRGDAARAGASMRRRRRTWPLGRGAVRRTADAAHPRETRAERRRARVGAAARPLASAEAMRQGVAAGEAARCATAVVTARACSAPRRASPATGGQTRPPTSPGPLPWSSLACSRPPIPRRLF